MAKILVTGATGFVGKRLVLYLLDQGHEIYALSRIKGMPILSKNHANLHEISGDLRDKQALSTLPKDIDAAYYLVHSMTDMVSDLIKTELEVAKAFSEALQKTEVKQIIYLGGIINDSKKLSPHLRSRLLVEDILKKSGIPTTILRASLIIGTGSASFEIIRDLTEKLPFMIAPKWVNTLCQPLAIRDVILYLSGVLLNERCYSKTFDIGGPETLTFKSLLKQFATFRKLKRIVINVPFLTPRLSSLWLVFITPVRFSLCYYLVESMKCSSVVKLDEIQSILDFKRLTFRESLELAFQKIEQNEVISTWMDSWEMGNLSPDIEKYIEVPKEGCLKDVQRVPIVDSREKTLDRLWSIGGNTGWYALNWAWKLRGLIDQLIGGVGLNRGRRHPHEILVGDPIDFWRVILADKEKGELILFSGMKVPGEAWLSFKLKSIGEQDMLIQTATFRPRGLLGRLYWYFLIPFHFFIFKKMAQSIAGKN